MNAGLQELAAKIDADKRVVIYWEWKNFWARKYGKVLKRAGKSRRLQFERNMIEDLKLRLLDANNL